MMLQSDPTIVYGHRGWQGARSVVASSRARLEEKTPYNTYAITGSAAGPDL